MRVASVLNPNHDLNLVPLADKQDQSDSHAHSGQRQFQSATRGIQIEIKIKSKSKIKTKSKARRGEGPAELRVSPRLGRDLALPTLQDGHGGLSGCP